MKSLPKTMKKAPTDAHTYDNGDLRVKLPSEAYEKGKEMFGYYTPTKSGFKLERKFWRGNACSQYNWVKVNNPDFDPKGKPKAKSTKDVKKLAKMGWDNQELQKEIESSNKTPEVKSTILTMDGPVKIDRKLEAAFKEFVQIAMSKTKHIDPDNGNVINIYGRGK